MAALLEDLEKYNNEYYTKQDLLAGLKLVARYIVEFGGGIALCILVLKLLAILSGALSLVGLALTPAMVTRAMLATIQGYVNASAEQRKALRAVATFFNSGFSFDRFSN